MLTYNWSNFANVGPTQVGDTGSTVVEESQTLVDEVEFTEGLTIDRGYLSPYFINDQERSLCEMKKPKVKASFLPKLENTSPPSQSLCEMKKPKVKASFLPKLDKHLPPPLVKNKNCNGPNFP